MLTGANKSSKDGKVKSKNFNLFTQAIGGNKKKSEKAASSLNGGSNASSELHSDGDDDVSEKLVKQISASINSYSLEKASNNEKTSGDKREESDHSEREGQAGKQMA